MNELFIDHADMVQKLAKDGEEITVEMNPFKAHLMHMVFGICGEAGELLDAVKKYVIYNKELDMDNIIEELGDIEFYMEGFRQELKLNRGYVLLQNVKKLSERYSTGKYSDNQANERADKQENV